MKSAFFKMECLTNMHVGSGDVNYNIIDNEVERDPVSKYPCINSSGVKGALREYFKPMVDKDTLFRMFGSDESGNTSPGKLKIMAAEMLAIPARASAGEQPFYRITTEAAIDRYISMKENLTGKKTVRKESKASEGCEAEGIKLIRKIELDGINDLFIMEESKFRNISLPVMARNNLDENGISKNLWYEEVVPHESVFFFSVIVNDADEEELREFEKHVAGKIVQFGGNASIGYGLCKISVMEA